MNVITRPLPPEFRSIRGRYPIFAFILLLVMGVVLSVWTVWAFLSLVLAPDWVVTVSNDDRDMTIIITTTASANPYYTVNVKGETCETDHVRLVGHEANVRQIKGVRSLFLDRTEPPGRWRLQVGRVDLDFRTTVLIVDGTIECRPGNAVTVYLKNRGELGSEGGNWGRSVSSQ